MDALKNILAGIIAIVLGAAALVLLYFVGTVVVVLFWISTVLATIVFFAWLLLLITQEYREQKAREERMARNLLLKQEREFREILEEAETPTTKKPLE